MQRENAFWSELVSVSYVSGRQTSEAVLFWLLAGIFPPLSACTSSLISLLSLKIKKYDTLALIKRLTYDQPTTKLRRIRFKVRAISVKIIY